jgi:hypothetical protein
MLRLVLRNFLSVMLRDIFARRCPTARQHFGKVHSTARGLIAIRVEQYNADRLESFHQLPTELK